MNTGIAVVVPAFNEERLIEQTLASIPDYVQHVVVVDDASTDRTPARVQAFGDPRVQLVRHRHNQGVGGALITGYRQAFAQGARVAAVMAGDGQMDPRDLPLLLQPVLRAEAEYVKGDRLSHPQLRRRMPWTRRLGNRVLAALTRWTTGVPVRDSQCGYTALSRHAAEQLPLSSMWRRYGYPNDLLALLADRDMRVREVMVRPVYGQEQSGVRLRDALFVVPYVLLRGLLRRLRSRRGTGALWLQARDGR